MVAVRLTLLGGFDARLAAGEAISLPTKRAQALLAYLGLRPGQPHQRDKLAALLWGERSDTQARDGLRHALAVLRKALAGVSPPPLLVEGQTLALDPAVVEVDVATFEHRLAEGTSEPLERAAELYQGDLLLGFAVNEPLFEEWLVAERERLRELALEALARLLAHQTKTGRTERAIQTAVRLLGLDPLQEPVHRTLMRLYARQGRRGTALKQYQVCVATLQRELGTEPETETKALYQELLRRPAPAARTRNHEGDDPARPARLAGRARVELPAGDTPLVGREVELRRLRELLEEAIGGRGHVAIVTGEAGVGKTRLLATLVTEAVDRDCRVLIGRGHDGEAILPFGPWVDACRAGEIGPQEEAVAALAPVWRAELSRLLPDVGARGLPSPGNSDLRLFESVAQLVEQLAARRPVMLLLEDLHWADDMSMRLLSFVSRRVRRWGVLLVATAREEELDEAVLARRILGELARQPGTVPLALSPLSRPDTTCLVQALARAGIEADEMARLETHVWAVSEGNPFVAIESIRAFQEGSIPPGSSRRPIPQRVREIVIGRLERLSDAARQLVAVAAVIGREFDFPLVQRAAGLDDITAARAVEELVRRLVFSGTGERLDFTHDRIRVAAYGELVPPRRKLLHRQAGEALEALHACDLDPHALALGVHFREGEAWEKAGWYMWRAGTQAVARSAYRQAVASFEEALAALRHLPQTPERLAQAVDLHLEARQALYPLGEVEGIFAHLQAAEAAVVTLGDQRRLAAVLADLTLYFLQVAELARGVTTGQRAVALADALDDFGLSVAANQYLGQIHLNLGAFRDAKAIFQRHRGALEGDLLREHFGMAGYPSVFYRSLLGYCHAELGEFVEAVVLGERAIGIAEDVEQPYACAVARSWLGRTHLVRGDFDRASRVLEQALDIAEARELGWPALGAELGYARAMSGQLPDGLRLLERAARLPQAQSPGRVFTWLGEAYLMAGRLADGAAAARRALALARHHHQRGIEASALSLLGQIALSEDAPHAVDAEEPYRQALALAEELGMRPLVAHCHLGLGKLYRRTGKREQAHEHLTVATTMYRNMGMTYWLEKVEAEVREVG